MAYKYEKQPNGDGYDLVISGWENGIADSPYLGLASMKNLNIQYLPGAIYSNFARTSSTAATTIGFPKYWTASSPDFTTGAVTYYMIDSNGQVWTSSGSTWTQLAATGPGGAGNGIVAFSDDGGTPWLLAFDNSGNIKYYNAGGNTFTTIVHGTGLASGTGLDHYAIWSQNTNTIYFCNGNTIGSIILTPGFTFDPAVGANYTVNTSALALPYYEMSTWLVEFGSLLMISAGSRIYPWDQLSTFYNAPLSIKEQIKKMINVQNILYVLAGYRGNIYMSNGYSISLFKKIPDSFFTNTNSVPIVEPPIWWGDVMSFRNKLYIGCTGIYGTGSSGNTVISGIFSIQLGVNVTGAIEVAGALNFESQNSYGLTCLIGSTWNSAPLAGLGSPNCLINQNSVFQPLFFSCWFNGTTGKGGVDSTASTPCVSSETILESDLIPIGTFAQNQTFQSFEFKLDEPFGDSGQSITMFGRQSLSDTYVQIGTTSGSSQVLSALYPATPFQNGQWLQIKVVLNSSVNTGVNFYTRLKEVRMR